MGWSKGASTRNHVRQEKIHHQTQFWKIYRNSSSQEPNSHQEKHPSVLSCEQQLLQSMIASPPSHHPNWPSECVATTSFLFCSSLDSDQNTLDYHTLKSTYKVAPWIPLAHGGFIMVYHFALDQRKIYCFASEFSSHSIGSIPMSCKTSQTSEFGGSHLLRDDHISVSFIGFILLVCIYRKHACNVANPTIKHPQFHQK